MFTPCPGFYVPFTAVEGVDHRHQAASWSLEYLLSRMRWPVGGYRGSMYTQSGSVLANYCFKNKLSLHNDFY